ncbi:hypothetical protein [Pasteurella sp. PK-2025]|uniref:hypothetical protein n=1 Tax=Pasteurella sp. PK-2025 TaxID=3413133 RepID=UPI003C784ADF
MKPINSVAVAMLLSLGIVACSGNGSSNTGNTSQFEQSTPKKENQSNSGEPSLPTPQNNQVNHSELLEKALGNTDYINENDPNKEVIVLENRNISETRKSKFSEIYLEHQPNNIIEISGRPISNNYIQTDHIILDANYLGKLYFTEEVRDLNIGVRSVVFKLENKSISGHSVKTSSDDIQIKFEKTNLSNQTLATEGKTIKVLGFNGIFDATKGKQKFDTGTYFGYFTGQSAEEIVGEALGKEKIIAGFLAEKQPNQVTRSKP